MAAFRITCTRQSPADRAPPHAHIAQVGTGDDRGYWRLWSVDEIYAAMDAGDQFYVLTQSGRPVWVCKNNCSSCGHRILRSGPIHRDIEDDKLYLLPTCKRY